MEKNGGHNVTAFTLRNDRDETCDSIYEQLAKFVLGRREPSQAFRRCIGVTKSLKASHAFVENDYVCADYLSEYKLFYAGTFASLPKHATRIHFFRDETIRSGDSDEGESLLPSGTSNFEDQDGAKIRSFALRAADTNEHEYSYLGYMVIRPGDLTVVGRTVLAVPEKIPVRTAVPDVVHIQDVELTVCGVPFMEQDRRVGVCAHVAAWICMYSIHRSEGGRRYTIGDIIQAAHPQGETGRFGLSPADVMKLFERLGRTPSWYGIGDVPAAIRTPWHQVIDPVDTSILLAPVPTGKDLSERFKSEYAEAASQHKADFSEALLRTNNSGIPTYVSSRDHAWVVVGHNEVGDPDIGSYYQEARYENPDEGPNSNDDSSQALTPLALAEKETVKLHYMWLDLICPLPPNVYLGLREAEIDAGVRFRSFIAGLPELYTDPKTAPSWPCFIASLESGSKLRLRTYTSDASKFRTSSVRRKLGDSISSQYHRLLSSRHLVVVELVAKVQDDYWCIGEAIYEGTSSPMTPHVLCLRIGGLMWLSDKTGRLEDATAVPFSLARSGSPGKLASS